MKVIINISVIFFLVSPSFVSGQTKINIVWNQTSKPVRFHIRDKFDDDLSFLLERNQKMPYVYRESLNFILIKNLEKDVEQPIYLTSDSLNIILGEKTSSDEYSNASILFNDFLIELNRNLPFTNYGYLIYEDFIPLKAPIINNFKLKYKSFLFNYNEQVEALEKYKMVSTTEKLTKKKIIKDFDEMYMLKFLIPYVHWNIDTIPIFSEIVLKLNSFRDKIVNNKDKDENSGQYTRRLAYYYNRFLNRKNMNASTQFSSLWDTASIVFQGDMRSFLRFNLLKKYYKKDVTNYQKYKSEFFNSETNLAYIDYLNDLYYNNERKLNQDELNSQLEGADGRIYTLQQILDQHKDKNKYLSFWASWCSPCRAEMKDFDPNFFEFDKYNTSNIFISTDESSVAWERAIGVTNTQNSSHFRLTPNSILQETLKIQNVPHHVLITKENTFFSNTAPNLSAKDELILALKRMTGITK